MDDEVLDPRQLPVKDIYCGDYQLGTSHRTVRPRGSGDWLLTLTKAGAGRYVTPRGTVVTGPGDLVLYAPTDPQDYGTAPGAGTWRYIFVHFAPKPHWIPLLDWPMNATGLRFMRLEQKLQDPAVEALERVFKYYWYKPYLPSAWELARTALEEALRWLEARRSPHTSKTILDARVSRATAYIDLRLAEPLALDAIAAHCNMSVSRLAHVFRAHTGMSPRRYIERQRLRRAGHLLGLEGLTVAEIASMVGFDDPSYFASRFRRWSGKSPTAFREDARSRPRHRSARGGRAPNAPGA